MQFKLSAAILLLASYAAAQTPGEELDNVIDNIQSIGDNIGDAATSVFDNIGDAATSVFSNIGGAASDVVDDIQSIGDNIGEGASSVWDNVESGASGIVDDFENINLPTITSVPSDIDNWWNGVENELGSLPTDAWESIKDGVYPAEISQWVESLPENLRAEASSRLDALAEDVGQSAANENRILAAGAAAAAGILALAVML